MAINWTQNNLQAVKPTPQRTASPGPQKPVAPSKSSGYTGYKYPARAKAQTSGLFGRLMGTLKKGGKIKKTGAYKLHKGERVLNKKQTKKFDQKKFNKARMAYAKGN